MEDVSFRKVIVESTKLIMSGIDSLSGGGDIRESSTGMSLCRPARDSRTIGLGYSQANLINQDPSGRTHILKFSSSDQSYFVSGWQRKLLSGQCDSQCKIC